MYNIVRADKERLDKCYKDPAYVKKLEDLKK